MKNLCLALALLTTAAHAVTIPSATGTTLDGHIVTLPHDLPGHATVLILSFSKNSQAATTAWERPVRAALATEPGIGYFDIPFLEDAPSFIRPVILRSIRRQVPDIVKSHFLPLIYGESSWKQVTGFTPTAPDAAYVLLVDNAGTVRWQTHEPYSTALFDQLSVAAKKLISETR